MSRWLENGLQDKRTEARGDLICPPDDEDQIDFAARPKRLRHGLQVRR